MRDNAPTHAALCCTCWHKPSHARSHAACSAKLLAAVLQASSQHSTTEDSQRADDDAHLSVSQLLQLLLCTVRVVILLEGLCCYQGWVVGVPWLLLRWPDVALLLCMRQYLARLLSRALHATCLRSSMQSAAMLQAALDRVSQSKPPRTAAAILSAVRWLCSLVLDAPLQPGAQLVQQDHQQADMANSTHVSAAMGATPPAGWQKGRTADQSSDMLPLCSLHAPAELDPEASEVLMSAEDVDARQKAFAAAVGRRAKHKRMFTMKRRHGRILQ